MTTTNPEVETRTAAAFDGVRLEYAIVGSGDPIVFLHGLFTGRAGFSRQHELADRWKLILPSTRAHDGTDGRLPPGYDIGTTEVDDLLAVLNAEGLDRFYLVGHSSGGTLAFALARNFPARVKRMVLIEPTLFGLLNSPEREEITRMFSSFANAGQQHGDRAGLNAALNWLVGHAWSSLDDIKKAARLDVMAPMEHLIVPHVRSLVNFKATTEDVQRLNIPTLLIYGGASYPVEAEIADRFRTIRPDWQQVLVDAASHNCFRENPLIVNAAIRRFLAE